MARHWSADGDYRGPRPKRGFAVTVGAVNFTFDSQREQFPPRGSPGLGFLQVSWEGKPIDVVLHRDADGVMDGVLYHYPVALPPLQAAGSFNVFVAAERQRQGIGTALLRAAGPRFNLALTRQQYTAAGAALVQRFVAGPR